jgi:protein tyrosine phosphatase
MYKEFPMRFLCLIGLVCSFASPTFAQYSETERNQLLATIVATDLAKIPPEDVKWVLDQAVKAKDFEKKMYKVNVSKISKHLRKISKLVIKPAVFGSSKEHRGKNTYGIPYDETRALRHIPDFYISASDVLTPKQAYIVGEEPTKATLPIFWQAIIHGKVTTIVALSMPKQGPYYSDDRYPIFVDGWTISKISEEEVAHSPFILAQKTVKRVFWAMKDGQKREIKHIHVENWPDHGAIEGTLFHHLLTYVEYLNPDGSSPIYVHCAAGIGRSGTFVAAHSIYKELTASKSRKDTTINIPLRILQMRMQRKNMLSREVQIAAVINAIREKVRQ